MYINRAEYSIEGAEENIHEDLIKLYHHQVYTYCYNILRDHHDAEDAVQEVFIKIYQSKNISEINNHRAWLYKIAYNNCLNKIRRKALIKFIPFTEKDRLKKEPAYDQHSDFELNYILS
ncbi:RNA polymerase sigma factor, partial [Bacillus sp. JJ1773]|uniref:RNA polymerase sigma factor n=1 Tax=Bacillus sp. JJ1773 TaxID=3122965 RepID=UPI002FFF23C6